jgi:site-specific recombinase XerD
LESGPKNFQKKFISDNIQLSVVIPTFATHHFLPKMSDIVALNSNSALAGIEEPLIEKMASYARKGLEGAANTQRAYHADLKQFESWCTDNGQISLPASATTLAAYMAVLAENCLWATINRKLAAISKFHQVHNFRTPSQDPQFKIVMEGIKRTKGIRQKQSPAFTIAKLKKILEGIDTQYHATLRNKALILLGFTGAFRRSELVALNIEDLSFTEEGLIANLHKSKTNQYGDYEEKAIFYSPEVVYCPIRTIQTWISMLGQESGPLFVRVRKGDRPTADRLTDKSVNDIVKSYFGMDYSAHSLRASFVTIAKVNGADDSEVMRQTKHKTSLMIQRYTRLENIKQHNAATKLGL